MCDVCLLEAHSNNKEMFRSRGQLHKNYKSTVTITGHTSFMEACDVTLVILTIVSLYFFMQLAPGLGTFVHNFITLQAIKLFFS
jgi:hypothetical protein